MSTDLTADECRAITSMAEKGSEAQAYMLDKGRSPAEFDRRQVIQWLTNKGILDRGLWMIPEIKATRGLKPESPAECGTWRSIQR